mgnify:CR=1 FL=1
MELHQDMMNDLPMVDIPAVKHTLHVPFMICHCHCLIDHKATTAWHMLASRNCKSWRCGQQRCSTVCKACRART